jgi:hypothetical protein
VRLAYTQESPGPGNGYTPTRRPALDNDADRIWALMIQRELCGVRFWEAVEKEYGIPREVPNLVGQVRHKRD